MKELISDISWRKGFTHAALRERDGSEGDGGRPWRGGSQEEKEIGGGRGSAVAPKLLTSFPTVDAEDFFVLPFVSRARKRNTLS